MRWLRRILLICLIAPVLVIALVLIWLQTDIGHRQLAGLIAWSTRDGTTQVKIGAIEGSIPIDITLRDLHIADSQGDWLRGDNIHLAWSPLALFSRSVKIDILHADSLILLRTPASTTPEPSPAPSEAPSLPQLPVNLQLQSLSIDQITLPQSLAGSAMTLAIDAHASLLRGGDLSAGLYSGRVYCI
jgi:translocation and assembly module TamB